MIDLLLLIFRRGSTRLWYSSVIAAFSLELPLLGGASHGSTLSAWLILLLLTSHLQHIILHTSFTDTSIPNLTSCIDRWKISYRPRIDQYRRWNGYRREEEEKQIVIFPNHIPALFKTPLSPNPPTTHHLPDPIGYHSPWSHSSSDRSTRYVNVHH